MSFPSFYRPLFPPKDYPANRAYSVEISANGIKYSGLRSDQDKISNAVVAKVKETVLCRFGVGFFAGSFLLKRGQPLLDA